MGTRLKLWAQRGRCGYVQWVDDVRNEDERPPLSSSGWTSSRAKRVYMIQHASLEELLEYLGLEPMPDAPPADIDSPE